MSNFLLEKHPECTLMQHKSRNTSHDLSIWSQTRLVLVLEGLEHVFFWPDSKVTLHIFFKSQSELQQAQWGKTYIQNGGRNKRRM